MRDMHIASPPPVGDAHAYTCCKHALCRGAWTLFSSFEFSKTFLKKKTVEHQFLNPLCISRICYLSLHQSRLGHQVRSTDHVSRKVCFCVMATVLWDHYETCDDFRTSVIIRFKIKSRYLSHVYCSNLSTWPRHYTVRHWENVQLSFKCHYPKTGVA